MSRPSRRTGVARALAALGAVTVAAIVAGCASIPMTGAVVAGPVIDDQQEPTFVISPPGPVEGAEPEAILTGFMQAVRAPQNDYQIARQFLTDDFAGRWDPDAGVLVRTGPAITTSRSASEPDSTATPSATATANPADPVTLAYSFDATGSVDDRGQYREQVPATFHDLEFQLVQIDGQWRISSADDGVVVSTAGFTLAFAPYALQYFDPSHRFLVPDVRWFANRPTAPNRVVAALLEGPSDYLVRAVVTDFPLGTTLGPGAVDVRNGVVHVDLSAEAESASPDARERMRQQLIATLGGAVDASSVDVTADGLALTTTAQLEPPIMNPLPAASVLVGIDDAFGVGTPEGVIDVEGLSAAIVAANPVGVTLARDGTSAALLASDGTVQLAQTSLPDALVVDARPGLVVPSLDTHGVVWSAQAQSSGSLIAITPDGEPVALATEALPPSDRVVALAVSRDGTRLMLAVSRESETALLVFGIVRDGPTPLELTDPLEIAVPAGVLLDAAWLDDRTLTALVQPADAADDATSVAVLPLGAPPETRQAPPGATALVGGRGGALPVRLLVDGEVMVPGSRSGWSSSGVGADYLGTQQ